MEVPESLMYLIEKRFEMAFTKIKDIHLYLVSLVDRILKVVADMNLRLNYVMQLCLGLSESPEKNKEDMSSTIKKI